MRTAFLLLLLASSLAQAATYVIDSSHTYPMFEIDHLGFSIQRGQFDETTGIIELDQLSQTGRIEIFVKTASLDSGHTKRDETLKGPDWFDVERFPVMVYRSQQLILNGTQLVAVDGELTLHGITRPLRLEIQKFKCGLNLAARKRGCGADVTGTLKRSEFGMSTGLPFVGDEVRLRIQVEAYSD